MDYETKADPLEAVFESAVPAAAVTRPGLSGARIMARAEDAIAAIHVDLPGWRIASLVFLRSIVVRDAAGPWAGLVEHRVRMLAQ
jgi:hypothetical protein